MELYVSRLKYRPSVEKALKQIKKFGLIGLTSNMPFGLTVHYAEGASNLIMIYKKSEYLPGREVWLPEWILTKECLDRRYKPKLITINEYND